MSFRMLPALLSLLAISPALAQPAPANPNEHGIFDSGSKTPDSKGFLTKQMLDSELGRYVTGDALTSTLSSYLTKDQAAAIYLPLAGGAVQTLAVTTSFSPPSVAFDDLPRPCTPPLIAYVPDGHKFWTAMTADHNAGLSNVYKDTNSTNSRTYVGFLLVNGSPSWVPFLINSQAGNMNATKLL